MFIFILQVAGFVLLPAIFCVALWRALVPPKSDKKNVAGNHVLIACKGASILLAHLQASSVEVTPGAEISVGAVVGRVGNSGNTSEPHLHVHAVREGTGAILEGEGMPLLFDGRFLVRNDRAAPTS